MPPHLGHEEFFSSLADLLSKASQKARGSVFLTQKPLIDSTASSEDKSSSRPSILIRATDGNTNAPNPKNNKVEKKTVSKVKLSTIVAPEDLEAFYTRYAEVCKTGMTGLKKRDRKKGKAKGKGGASKAAKA
ncbi:signal recognition particle, SRP14 subunit [Aspergillus coremiiformis]|uniref:Signal recognition particle subunit SRP14 n=1 Tax=Aspergillus coremiiformis TaxID=138285 RepID=A0A5N6ZG63_9EURO|nr:signal recognition particle, SRP14 subunit [Aspergillus coremiiformis]